MRIKDLIAIPIPSISYVSFFMPQYVKAKIARPTIFIAANVRVAVLPQSQINSLIKRPMVPILSKIKPLSLVASLIDIPPKFVLTITLLSYP